MYLEEKLHLIFESNCESENFSFINLYEDILIKAFGNAVHKRVHTFVLNMLVRNSYLFW